MTELARVTRQVSRSIHLASRRNANPSSQYVKCMQCLLTFLGGLAQCSRFLVETNPLLGTDNPCATVVDVHGSREVPAEAASNSRDL